MIRGIVYLAILIFKIKSLYMKLLKLENFKGEHSEPIEYKKGFVLYYTKVVEMHEPTYRSIIGEYGGGYLHFAKVSYYLCKAKAKKNGLNLSKPFSKKLVSTSFEAIFAVTGYGFDIKKSLQFETIEQVSAFSVSKDLAWAWHEERAEERAKEWKRLEKHFHSLAGGSLESRKEKLKKILPNLASQIEKVEDGKALKRLISIKTHPDRGGDADVFKLAYPLVEDY